MNDNPKVEQQLSLNFTSESQPQPGPYVSPRPLEATVTAKAKIVNQSVVRLTIELSNTHAAELGGLLAHYVDWEDFPWAEAIYDALVLADIRGEAVFWDDEFGRFVFLRRKRG